MGMITDVAHTEKMGQGDRDNYYDFFYKYCAVL